ncbi:unnamed protein product [Prorocentrum cordatum]|uniref:Uncharacterized protein n=1 Tax=Prorocentrum cordatum TaxID=2364126 RepID=A0ABN9W263_9DINO|nr:unnamed protein product [Polarella glacialis]CAK0878593.1 unnamed protein product [Polarella glacialis]
MFHEGQAALAEQGQGKAVRHESCGPSSAPTRCPTAEFHPFVDDPDADAHEESWGATALPRDGDELELEAALLDAVLPGGGRPQRGSAVPAPRAAPVRRLRSEAFWAQEAAAAARRPTCSPWEVGVRRRRPCLDEEGCLGPAAAATPAAEGAGAAAATTPAAGGDESRGGAAGCPRSWAGAVARELRRAARGPVAPPAPPPGPASAQALGAALRLRGRSYRPAGSR